MDAGPENGAGGVAGGASYEQTVAPADDRQLLDHLDDQARAGRSLRVAEDQRRTVVVEAVDLDPQLTCEVDVIDREGIMRLDHGDVVQLQSR